MGRHSCLWVAMSTIVSWFRSKPRPKMDRDDEELEAREVPYACSSYGVEMAMQQRPPLRFRRRLCTHGSLRLLPTLDCYFD